MEIIVENLGKRFNREWIFKNLSFTFSQGHSYAITGANGTGKSTLLQIIAGIIPASEGNFSYKSDKAIPLEDIYQFISLAAPYQELIEEFTLEEALLFHTKFRKLRNGISIEELVDKLSLRKSFKKEIRNFSSGMKQKLKLGLALYTESDIVLLDEPTTNLDSHASDWYRTEILKLLGKCLLLVCSNQSHEYDFCTRQLQIENYK